MEDKKLPAGDAKVDQKPPEERGQETLGDIRAEAKKRRPHRRTKPKRGRPARKTPPESKVIAEAVPGEDEAVSSACGVTVAETIFALGQAIGGDEWKPTENERSYLVDAWSAYFRAKGITDLPPGWAVVIATSAYAMPRLRKPKTKARITDLFLKARGWFRTRFGKDEEGHPEDEK